VGSALVKALLAHGHEVTKVVRPGGPVGAGSVLWDPADGTLDAAALEGFDGVVHLAGENIASGKWTKEQKQRIRDSRVDGTALLCSRLRILKRPPQVFIQASAVGYYGDRGDEELTEASPGGRGFLAEVTREWEAASSALDGTAVRVVRLRTGVVLAREGGALAKMLGPFRTGLGGKVGSGRQYVSWITLGDLVSIIEFALEEPRLNGAVNAVAPNPVTNAELTRTLGKVLGRPAIATLPAFVARTMLGRQMADELLLASTRVIPQKLLETGYYFSHPDLEAALRDILGK
jgi:uncharacterized protein (TIGR01777 family)